MSSSPAESASPALTTSLMCLPNELLQKVTEHLLPDYCLDGESDEKPLDAIRLGAACHRLHDLVIPLAFKELGMRDREHTNSWLADCLAEYGHHVAGLSIYLPDYVTEDGALLAACVQRCANCCTVRIHGEYCTWDDVVAVLAPIASSSLRKLEFSLKGNDMSMAAPIASLIRRSDGLQTLVLDFYQETQAALDPLTDAWQACAGLEHLTARYTRSNFDNFEYGRGVPPLRTLSLAIYDVLMRTLVAFLKAFSETLVELELRCSSEEIRMGNELKPDSLVLLSKCTTLTTGTLYSPRDTVCILSALIDPETPISRIMYTATYDSGMMDAIKTFHAKQSVKTLRHVRFLRGHDELPVLSTYIDSQKQLKSLRVWGASNGIDVDIDDMRIPKFDHAASLEFEED
ncbi:hypothetical protein JCM10908_006861 [Rhodotorula pacifica]|uniref:uncharacterized protein n=1 Tax=Rhodotorula pacifica TaxID=1495444 RepID=UPI003179A89E